MAGYNQLFQELLNPLSPAHSEETGINFFLVRISDAVRSHPGTISENSLELLNVTLRASLEVSEAFRAFAKRSRRESIVLLCPTNTDESSPAGLASALEMAHDDLERSLRGIAGITVLKESLVENWYPVAGKFDPESDQQGHIPFVPEYYASLGATLMRKARTLLEPPLKAVIVDGDNTLWSGVVGESGAMGVILSEDRKFLHRKLLDLKSQGVLLALASKNVLSDVASVLERPDGLLKMTDFAALKVSWQPKSQSIQELAAEWNLGPDSFVFLDDNPVECAQVSSACPSVTVVAVPEEEATLPAFINHLWALDAASTSALDATRTELMRQQAVRHREAEAAGSFREFIEGLQLKLEFRSAAAEDIPRMAQLTQRTNQFNATGIRRTEAEIASLLQSGSRQALMLHASDRFGDYGDVGLVIYHLRGSLLLVENFLLSCRVLGKGVEHRLLAEVGSIAAMHRCVGIVLPFKATERNQPVASFLLEFGQDCLKDGIYHFPTRRALEIKFDPDKFSPSVSGTSQSAIAEIRPKPDFAAIAWKLTTARAIVAEVETATQRSRPASAGPAKAAQSALQETLIQIWSEVLRVSPVGISDHFTDLGGQSLAAMRIVSRIATQCSVRLPLTSLFLYPTIEKLADRIGQTPVSAVSSEDENALLATECEAVSPPKQRLWFLDQLITHRPAYHISTARKLSGRLDPRALERALEEVCKRHSILRAVFPSVDGKPIQRLLEQAPAMISLHEATSEEEAMEVAQMEALRPFPLATGPLFRCALIRMGNDTHLLSCVFHHIISDGWSVQLFYDDLGVAYAAALNGQRPHWQPIKAVCSGFSAWVNQRMAKGEFAGEMAFWKKQLEGAPLVLQLPVDRPHPPVRTYEGSVVCKTVPPQVRQSLEAYSQEQKVTPYAVLAACFQLLLHRLSGRDDLLIGTPVAGRNHPSVQEVLGCFVNTVVLRSKCGEETSFSSHLKATRDSIVDALAHAELPFEALVDGMGTARDLSHPPLIQHLFVLQDADREPFSSSTIRSKPVLVHNGGAKVDLVLEVTPGDDGYDLVLEYNSAVLNAETAGRWLNHYCTLLEAALQTPDARVHDLTLLSKEERDEIVVGFNQAPREFGGHRCLHHWFEETVQSAPKAVALTCDGISLTYEELNRRANRIAHFLSQNGAAPDVLIGLCVDRSLDLVIGLLAILKAGAAYLPIDLSYPADRLAFMLEDAKAPLLLTQRSLCDRLPEHQARVVCVDDAELFASQSEDNALTSVTPDHMAYVIFTSGSTGRPKGCMVTHRNVSRLMEATEDWYHFNASDVWTLFHSTAFDFSVWELWGSLLYGGRLVVVPYQTSRSPDEFYQLLSNENVTVLNQTPSAFRQLIAAEDAAPKTLPLSLRFVIFGGEALEMQSLQPWFKRHGDQQPQLVNMYGITETTVHVTYRPISANDLQGGSVIGIPIPDLQVYILDAHLQPVPIGVPGEMYVGGAGLARGYLNRAELTSERFIPDPLSGRPHGRLYKTGDLARFLPGRDIEYLGRIDQQVKIRGFRIELGEIESVLASHPLVQEAAVIPREDTPGSKRLVAYLVASGEKPNLTELREHLNVKLPDYMIPAAFVLMEKFPITGNGKLDRAALPAPDQQHAVAGREFIAARSEAESKLVEVWSRVLKVARVGVEDNFFELGGDSILSIHMIAQARKVGLNFTPRQLFENQTISQLAALPQTSPVATLPALNVSTSNVPLLPIQHWFFDQQLQESHYWNQTFLFTVNERLNLSKLREAAQTLVSKHEALRLRFHRTVSGWKQSIAPAETADTLEIHHLDGYANGKLAAKVLEISSSIQQRLNYEQGPVIRLAYLDLGEDRPGRLLATAHHLAVDGVSWGILLSDLEAAYRLEPLPKVPATLPVACAQAASWATSDAATAEANWWKANIPAATAPLMPQEGNGQPNTEESAETIHLELSVEDTQTLLQQVPSAFRTRINDVLLGALSLAIHRKLKRSEICIHLEGHGREEVFGALDLSRTVGWFTAMFPVTLRMPSSPQVAEVLRATRDQLRAIPQQGAGYGHLLYLDESSVPNPAADLVFNYLGRLDQITEASELFHHAAEPTGPWHSSKALRKHAHEIDCAVLRDQFRLEWKFSRNLHRAENVRMIAEAFMVALREIIHLSRNGERAAFSPQDFPMVTLDQATIDQLTKAQNQISDILPLSPIQELFYGAAAAKINAGYDQWSSRIVGRLDVKRFQAAWNEVLQRHAILRASFHSAGLVRPIQVIHEKLQPSWELQDWREVDFQMQQERWQALLKADATRSNDLSIAPLSRFTLIQLASDEWRFLWSVPELLLDGWSWPIVFGEVASLLKGESLNSKPHGTYKSYLAYLARQDATAEESFWKNELAGFNTPTPLPLECCVTCSKNRRFTETSISLTSDFVERLTQFSRQNRTTPGTLIHAAWLLLLAQTSGKMDVVCGTASNGRPDDLPDVESIVGPFINNLPLRISLGLDQPALDFLNQVRTKLVTLASHQHSSITQMQDWSQVPWNQRLFDSLVVFQNFSVDEGMKTLGENARLEDFQGPLHTNYPLTLVVSPGATYDIVLAHLETACSVPQAELILADWQRLLEALISMDQARLTDIMNVCLMRANRVSIAPAVQRQSDGPPPRTELEKRIAAIWQKAFGLTAISINDNFFDLGGQSLLMLRVHQRLREELGMKLSIVQLFQHPTIALLARAMEPAASPAQGASVSAPTTPQSIAVQARNRAAAARAAIAKARGQSP